jgi:hypothetical protein
MSKKINTVSIKLTWSNSVTALIALIEKGNAEGRAHAEKELRNMAKLADLYAESMEKNKLVKP